MSNNDLISREALKEDLHNEIGDHALSTAIDRVIDNAPTELYLLTVKATDEDINTLKQLLKDYKPQILTPELERPEGEFIRMDLAKNVIAKFKGYLDEDMIERIQIALEKESNNTKQ